MTMHVGPRGTPTEGMALAFAHALARRDFEAAWNMGSAPFRSARTPADLAAAFESIIPGDWGPVDPIEIGMTMDDWPGKGAAEVEWVSVSLGGDVYSEGLTVIVGDEGICAVEWGRP